MSCHKNIKADSPLLAPIRDSYFGEDADKDGRLSDGEDVNGDGVLNSGPPVPWVRIHKHQIMFILTMLFMLIGVSCVECHGRVDQMEVVHHDQPLSMAWCLECHRNPEDALRPMSEVTNLSWMSVSDENNTSILLKPMLG